jgi:hypothetical protein
MNMKLNHSILRTAAVAAILLAATVPSFASGESSPSSSGPSAFELVKAGDHYVGDPSKDKVLEIYSEKSVAGLTPSIWYVEYYDPDACSRSVKVKFGAGLKLDVSRPWKPFDSGKLADVIDVSKLKVDSDEAVRIATSQKLLQPFTLKHTQLWLRHSRDGLVWQVRLWADKLGHPDAVMDIGDIYLSPMDGQVVRADLHIERLN